MNKGINEFFKALFGEKNVLKLKDGITDDVVVETIKEYVRSEEYEILNPYFGLEINSNNKYSIDEIWLVVKKYKDSKLGLSKEIKNYLVK